MSVLFAIHPETVGGVITRPLQAQTRSAWRLITRGVGHYPKKRAKGWPALSQNPILPLKQTIRSVLKIEGFPTHELLTALVIMSSDIENVEKKYRFSYG